MALVAAAVPAASQAAAAGGPARHTGRLASVLAAAAPSLRSDVRSSRSDTRVSRSARRAAIPVAHPLGAPPALPAARAAGKPAPPPPLPPPAPGPAAGPAGNAPAGNGPAATQGQAGTPAPPPITVDGSAGSRILAVARKYVGYPYVYAGQSPSTGFDCSGYVTFVYRQAGVANLTAQSEAQRHEVRIIPRSAARPGDLIFYLSGGVSYHVAIYAGGNMEYAAATPSEGVVYEPIWDSNIQFGTDWH